MAFIRPCRWNSSLLTFTFLIAASLSGQTPAPTITSSQTAPTDALSQPPTPTYDVHGSVVDDLTGKPLANAKVSL